MNRRKAIKSFMLTTGAIMIFPSCLRETGGASGSLINISINSEQESLLAEVVEALIPRTDTPGGKDLKLHLFVLKMLDDCHEAAEQKDFMTGLYLFNDSAKHHMGEYFTGASMQKKESFLTFLEENKDVPKELNSFFKLLKRRAIQGYLNSEYVMMTLIKYELVPGRYNGYMPVSSL